MHDSTYDRIDFDTIDGPYTLFQHFRYGEQCEKIVDEEWVEGLHFAIPDSLTEFMLVDSALYKSNCYFKRYAAWSHTNEVVTQGVIEGNKNANGDWSVNVDILLSESEVFPGGTMRIKFESLYTK